MQPDMSWGSATLALWPPSVWEGFSGCASKRRRARFLLTQLCSCWLVRAGRLRMRRQVLFIQGAGQGTYAEWDNKLVDSLVKALGRDYEVRYPRMPNEADP